MSANKTQRSPIERAFITGFVTLLILFVLAVILFPVFAKPREGHNRSCLSNVKQVALSFMIYSSDFDDKLPAGGDWQAAVWPYVKNDAIFHCSVAQRGGSKKGIADPAVFGIAANEALAGANLEKLAKPQLEPLAFDSTRLGKSEWAWLDTLPNPGRHEGRNSIGFADGHVISMALTGVPKEKR